MQDHRGANSHAATGDRRIMPPVPAPQIMALDDLPAAEVSSSGSSCGVLAEPMPALRPLALADFLRARSSVRPTRGRFDGVEHGP